ncbi:MAG: hypothetical protein LQ351_002831 [Letrouitia transgressa]|nr:MAG: hypothetical protein LQ351_002831 [Letrouitia transgressa]
MTDFCCCYYSLPDAGTRCYLPQVDLSAHATIVNSTSRTVLTQTFINPQGNSEVKECTYVFPLYDGVSVIDFHCEVGSRLIKGVVVEKNEARNVFDLAVERGETAGLLDQGPTGDVFTTTIGNIPADAKVIVKITYVGENKHDMGIDGVRYTIPTNISPRYSSDPYAYGTILLVPNFFPSSEVGKIRIVVDIDLADGSTLRSVSSPSHPIEVSIGNMSTCGDRSPIPSRASATLALETCELGKDFVLEIMFHGASPKAILETHPTIPGQRALMVTLVPQLDLPSTKPELIVVADRSGSMSGQKISTLRKALSVLLKSLPLGIPFNICSFGSKNRLLWPRSHHYGQNSLAEALQYVDGFKADFGGTETLAAIKSAVASRNEHEELAIVLCTDGDIWSQDDLFVFLNEQVSQSKKPLRVFPLGIGNCVSSSLIEGIARAGNGFAQTVQEQEKLEGKVIRMLKGALTPYVSDYALEIQYDQLDGEDDYILIDKVTDSLCGLSVNEKLLESITNADDTSDAILQTGPRNDNSQYSDLPLMAAPKLLQSPQLIPQLYAFNRTTVYMLISPDAHQRSLRSVVLKGTSSGRAVEYAFPVQVLDQPSTTIHQLAARNAMGELAEGRGWLHHAVDPTGLSIREKYVSQFAKLIEREAVRIGVQYQVAGKWCSFVAIEGNDTSHKLPPSLPAPPGIPSSAFGGVAPYQQCCSIAGGPLKRQAGDYAVRKKRQRQMDPTQHRTASGGRGRAHHHAVGRTANGRGGAHHHTYGRWDGPSPTSRGPADRSFPRGSKNDPLQDIISLQKFDGSWDINKQLLAVLAKSESKVDKHRLTLKPVPSKQLWATALAIAFLESKMAADKEIWELVVGKGRNWIEREQDWEMDGSGQGQDLSSKSWIDKAKAFLAAS